MFQAGIINFAVYENGSEYRGIANVQLPDLANKVLTVNGAGIAGDVELPVIGNIDAMTGSISFLDAPDSAYKLGEQRRHLVEFRAAHEEYDETGGKLVAKGQKHVCEIFPKKIGGGTLAPSAAQNVSGEYDFYSLKTIIDGKVVLDVCPAEGRYIDASGENRLAQVNKILGK